MNHKKIVNICLIFVAFLVYLVASNLFELVFDWLKWPVTRDYYLTTPEMIAVAFSVVLFLVASQNKILVGFLIEVVTELSKVTFPTPKESGQSAVVVIVMVALATLILAFFDSIWTFFTQLILKN